MFHHEQKTDENTVPRSTKSRRSQKRNRSVAKEEDTV